MKSEADWGPDRNEPCPECTGELRGSRRITYCVDCGASWLRPRTTATSKESR